MTAKRSAALASGVTFITVIDRVLSANLSPLKVQDNIEPSLDWAESRLRVTNVRDAHPAERTEGPNGVKFRGKIRHRRAPREAQWPGRSKLGTIPAKPYPQVIEYWLEITAVNAGRLGPLHASERTLVISLEGPCNPFSV